MKEKFDLESTKIKKLYNEFGGKCTTDPITTKRFTHLDGDSGMNRLKKRWKNSKKKQEKFSQNGKHIIAWKQKKWKLKECKTRETTRNRHQQ